MVQITAQAGPTGSGERYTLGMSSAAPITSRWTDDLLDRMRETVDPLADQVISELMASGNLAAVNAVVRTLVENDQLPPDGLPGCVQAYLASSAGLPSWADPDKIRKGEEVFWKYGTGAVSLLTVYALPFCYLGAKGVQVLAMTARLYTNPYRRIVETAQMVVDVMSQGGLAPAGKGIRTAQKVRLMHAGVRAQVHASGQWKPEWGQPINLEDMVGTLMAFSWVTLDGLRRLGTDLSDEEAEAYLHAWNVVGHILGLRDELLPVDMADAAALVAAIERRQFGASPEGQMMNRALVEMVRHVLPGNLLDAVPEMLMRHLLGDRPADMLGVAKTDWPKLLLQPLTLVNLAGEDLLNHDKMASRIAEVFSKSLINGMVWVGRGDNKPAFAIPTALREVWGVDWIA